MRSYIVDVPYGNVCNVLFASAFGSVYVGGRSTFVKMTGLDEFSAILEHYEGRDGPCTRVSIPDKSEIEMDGSILKYISRALTVNRKLGD